MHNPRDKRRGDILAVDDTPANLKLLIDTLENHGYSVRVAPSGKLALGAVEREPPELILMDVNMPGMNGYEVCEQLKANERYRGIPVVFISALDETLDKVRAFSVGGVDYVTKPFQFEEVEARVSTQLRISRTQREVEENYVKLKQIEELRDNLIHMMVHDMRSPLSAITSSLGWLREDLKGHLNPQSEEVIEFALTGGTRLLGMVNELLEISRLEAGQLPLELREWDICKIVRRGIASVESMLSGRRVELETVGPVYAFCDKGIVRRVVENLVSNGIKHTPPGGALRVVVEAQQNGVRVTVVDGGVGIPEEYREMIFEKFGIVRAREQKRYFSTGLGLAFCKLAMSAHRGEIGVESEQGKGSAFWFFLPSSGS